MFIISFFILLLILGSIFVPVYLFTNRVFFNNFLKIFFGIIILLVSFLYGFKVYHQKMTINKSDIYGSYIIDREKYKGKNADWQYNHYRFEITKDDEFVLYQIDNEKIVRVFKSKIEFIEGGSSPHIKIINQDPHFLLGTEPTLYRNSWDFYYVFSSKSYSSMFFKKGEWKPLNN